MPKTQIVDVVVPIKWEKYTIERTATSSAFAESGIIESDPEFDALASSGGQTVNMPFWKDLNAPRQILSDSTQIVPQKITAGQDVARIQSDCQAWSVNTLAKLLAGDDPMFAIVSLMGAYWGRQDDLILINSLKGVFAAPSMAPNLLAVHSESITGQSNATRLTGSTFVDALQRLGDRSDRLTCAAVHSSTEAALRKLDLIDFVPDSKGQDLIRVFQGRRVIIDDSLPVRGGTTDGTVYTTYLFGENAFGKGSALLDQPIQGGFGTEAIEVARSAADSDTSLMNRRRFLLHPRGVKFTNAAVAGPSPTDAELANGANWSLVWEPKNVRMVAVTHNN